MLKPGSDLIFILKNFMFALIFAKERIEMASSYPLAHSSNAYGVGDADSSPPY